MVRLFCRSSWLCYCCPCCQRRNGLNRPARIGWLTARYQSPLCAMQTPYADVNILLHATCYVPLSVLALRRRAANLDSALWSVHWPQELEEALLIQRLNEFVNGVPCGMMEYPVQTFDNGQIYPARKLCGRLQSAACFRRGSCNVR